MNDAHLALRRRHLRFGWYALLAFASVGAGLEALHAFKAGFYLDVGSETRRLMWRLGHAHGVLLALLQLAFAFTLPYTVDGSEQRLQRASACLLASGLLLPLGFLLGGVFAAGGDPGLGVLLVPLGLPLLLAGLWWTARSLR
jgi:hypothetical protein